MLILYCSVYFRLHCQGLDGICQVCLISSQEVLKVTLKNTVMVVMCSMDGIVKKNGIKV